MKKRIFATMSLAAALCACSKEQDAIFEPQTPEVNPQESTVFTATMEGAPKSAMKQDATETRATFDNTYKCASWEVGDEINIDGKVYIAQSSGTTTTFKAKSDPTTRWRYHDAFFSAYWDGSRIDTQGKPEFLIPSDINETWAEGKFNMPMYVHSVNSTELQFKNLCGVLKITVNSNQIASVKRIKVGSWPTMSGYCIAGGDGGAIISKNTNVPTTITYTTAVTTTLQGVSFYIAVPPGTYEDIKIELDPDGNGYTKYMTTKQDQQITIERNKIYPIVFEDQTPAPTRGTAKATIGGSEVDVPWVQLWEDGPKWAAYNIGVTDGQPESYGGYYCWGSSIDKDPNRKYKEGTESLSGNDDTAKAVWGSNWRMPTKEELELLYSKTTRDWTVINNINGYLFTGWNAYNGNSIFMPAAGEYEGKVNNDGFYLCYWTSTPYASTTNGYSWGLRMWNSNKRLDYENRNTGFSVRAVLMETN